MFVEAESRKIGAISLPVALDAAMREKAQRITIETPTDARVKLLMEDYRHFLGDAAEIKKRLDYLRELRGRDTVTRWQELVDKNQWTILVEELLEQHYDPSYLRSANRRAGHDAQAQTVALADLETITLVNTANTLLSM